MKINIKHILQGLTNTVFVKEEVEKVAAERMEICRKCPHNSKVANYDGIIPFEHCMKCGCNLHMKTRSLDSECPVGKWEALASEEESDKIDEALNNQNPTQDEDQ